MPTLSTVEAGQDEGIRLRVVDFDENDDNVESPLLNITGGGFDSKICSGPSKSSTDPNNPAPLYSNNMSVISLDQERNLTLAYAYLVLIPLDNTSENWDSRTAGLYLSESFLNPGTGLKQNKINITESAHLMFALDWWESAFNGHNEWPDDAGNYSAVIRFDLYSPTTPERREEGFGFNHNVGGYLQELEYDMGIVEVISEGEDCFPPSSDTLFTVMFYTMGAIGLGFMFFPWGWLERNNSIPRETERKSSGRSRYISNSVRGEVWARDQGMCVLCGSQEDLQFDHVIPHSKGGSNTAENLQILCKSCNLSKSDSV